MYCRCMYEYVHTAVHEHAINLGPGIYEYRREVLMYIFVLRTHRDKVSWCASHGSILLLYPVRIISSIICFVENIKILYQNIHNGKLGASENCCTDCCCCSLLPAKPVPINFEGNKRTQRDTSLLCEGVVGVIDLPLLHGAE